MSRNVLKKNGKQCLNCQSVLLKLLAKFLKVFLLNHSIKNVDEQFVKSQNII